MLLNKFETEISALNNFKWLFGVVCGCLKNNFIAQTRPFDQINFNLERPGRRAEPVAGIFLIFGVMFRNKEMFFELTRLHTVVRVF
jgi:hypothetical protein